MKFNDYDGVENKMNGISSVHALNTLQRSEEIRKHSNLITISILESNQK